SAQAGNRPAQVVGIERRFPAIDLKAALPGHQPHGGAQYLLRERDVVPFRGAANAAEGAGAIAPGAVIEMELIQSAGLRLDGKDGVLERRENLLASAHFAVAFRNEFNLT